MRIKGEITNGLDSEPVTSHWSYDPDDPLVVSVYFVESEVSWDFSLELLREAFTSPTGELHGSGDLLVEVVAGDAFLHLSNEISSTLKFSADKIQDFLDQVDDSGSEEIVVRELEEFLGAL